MFGRARILLTIAACLLATPVAAQAPATASTAFDGKYVGSATIMGGRASDSCPTVTSVDMTITGGQVVVHEIHLSGGRPTFQGTVNSAGEVSASHSFTAAPGRAGPNIDAVSGTIHDNVFIGQRLYGYWCYYTIQTQKVSATASTTALAAEGTTAFDGFYEGVSRIIEEDGMAAGSRGGCMRDGKPAPLTIVNGNATAGGARNPFEGTVNTHGVLVMHLRTGQRLDGQIDRKGNVTGRFIDACSYQYVWQKKER